MRLVKRNFIDLRGNQPSSAIASSMADRCGASDELSPRSWQFERVGRKESESEVKKMHSVFLHRAC